VAIVTPLARLANAATSNQRVANAMRRVVPERARLRLGTAIGVDKPQRLQLSRLELIRRRDPDWLADPDNLEHELLPQLGLCADIPGAFPRELQWAVGGGLKHWQAPNQFSRYLAHLARYPIRSYLEIGVRHGGTFAITLEYLGRFHPLTAATGIDIDHVPAMHTLARRRPEVRFLQLDTRSDELRREVEEHGPYDLVLVDADHSYEACRRDVDTVLEHARILALHDIVDAACPGVRQVWRELRQQMPGERDFFEFTAQYDEIVTRNGHPALGLGIAVRKDFRPS
jgi:predicted O-methyltransferase YrrM